MNLLLLNAASGSKLEQALEKLVDFGMDAGKDIFVAILIYSVGRFIIKQISVLIAKVLEKRKIETSVQTFLKSLVKILLNMVLAFAIISKLGVETTSFAALLASAGVAVGMALSGNLSNFAGGLIILVFKPFKVGDYIDGPGVSGTIKEIQIFHTILSTLDNRMIYVPNGMLSGNAVINYSKQEMRRVEWVFGVEYGEDVQRVRTVLQRIIYADKRILDTPAPTVDYLIDHFTFGPLIFCLVLVLHSLIYSLLHDIRPVQQFLCPSVLTGNPLCIFLSMGLLIHCVQHVLIFMQQMNGIRLFVFPEQQ